VPDCPVSEAKLLQVWWMRENVLVPPEKERRALWEACNDVMALMEGPSVPVDCDGGSPARGLAFSALWRINRGATTTTLTMHDDGG
jgi:hypothetical protein